MREKRRIGKYLFYPCEICGVWIRNKKDHKKRCNPKEAKETRQIMKKVGKEMGLLK